MVALKNAARVQPSEVSRFLIEGVSFDTYSRLVDDLERAGRRLNLTYDRGTIEVRMPLPEHELVKTFVGQLIAFHQTMTGGTFVSLGETTWRQRRSERGLEADECYYIQSASRIGTGKAIDLERDPPPDLVIEVELTSPLLDKLDIYRSMGVPELWRIGTNASVEFLGLNVGRGYGAIQQSRAIPAMTPTLLSQMIRDRDERGNAEALRAALNVLSARSPS